MTTKANHDDHRRVGLRRAAKVLTPMLILAGSFGTVSAAAAATDGELVSNGGTSRAITESGEEREESHEWEVEFEMTAFSWEFFFGELAPPPDPGKTIANPGRGG